MESVLGRPLFIGSHHLDLPALAVFDLRGSVRFQAFLVSLGEKFLQRRRQQVVAFDGDLNSDSASGDSLRVSLDRDVGRLPDTVLRVGNVCPSAVHMSTGCLDHVQQVQHCYH